LGDGRDHDYGYLEKKFTHRDALGYVSITGLLVGRLYQVGYTNLAAWPPMITFAYVVLRYLVGLGGLFALFDIIFRSRELNERIYAAVAVFAGVLFIALAF